MSYLHTSRATYIANEANELRREIERLTRDEIAALPEHERDVAHEQLADIVADCIAERDLGALYRIIRNHS